LHSINKTILIEIQQKRKDMIDLVNQKGISSDDTIRCSQELDQLIYQYQYFFRKERIHRGKPTNKENFHQWEFSPIPH
jgi:stage 0 sporulation regulatory protein